MNKQVEVPEGVVERLANELLLYRFGGHFSDGEYFLNRPEQGSRAYHREQALDNARRILAEDRLAIYKHFSDRLLEEENFEILRRAFAQPPTDRRAYVRVALQAASKLDE